MKRLLCLCLVACGAPAETPIITLAASLSPSQVASVSVTVIESKSKQGSALDCAALGETWIFLRDDIVVHFQTVVAFPNGTAASISPGTKLIVVADAFDQAGGFGNRVGTACADGVNIEAGHATPLTLVLAPTASP